MIDVEVLATGSRGNCYLLKSGDTRILLDCGLPYKKTLKLLDFKLPDAVLVTHEHKDHALAAKDFMNHGVDVYMSYGTADALKLEENHRLHLIDDKEFPPNGRFEFWAFEVKHDAAEPVNFLIHSKGDSAFYSAENEERILYLTDLGNVPKFNSLDATKILLEINFAEEELRNSEIDEPAKKRIFENHLSLEKAAEFLTATDLSECKEIYLIHISERHGDGEIFGKVIQEMVGDKIKVIVAKNKEL